MVTIENVKGGKWYKSTERLYLTAAGEVVKADDPDRKTLLIAAGCEMPYDVAEKYGLTKPAETPKAEEPEVKSIEEPAETKAIKAPAVKKNKA
jgi:hypothetical protein